VLVIGVFFVQKELLDGGRGREYIRNNHANGILNESN